MPQAHRVPTLEHRIDRLRQNLADFKVTINTRRQLLNNKLIRPNCDTCSPANTPGACGPTCPLLPFEKWLRDKLADEKLYSWVVKTMNIYKSYTTSYLVGEWEKVTERLRTGALNNSELYADAGWKEDYWPMRSTRGLDFNWSFDKAWGKAAQIEEPCPKYRPVVPAVPKSLKRRSSELGGSELKRGRRK